MPKRTSFIHSNPALHQLADLALDAALLMRHVFRQAGSQFRPPLCLHPLGRRAVDPVEDALRDLGEGSELVGAESVDD